MISSNTPSRSITAISRCCPFMSARTWALTSARSTATVSAAFVHAFETTDANWYICEKMDELKRVATA